MGVGRHWGGMVSLLVTMLVTFLTYAAEIGGEFERCSSP